MHEFLVIELGTVIRNDRVGNTETAADVLPDEPLDPVGIDLYKRLSFDPLGVIVDGDYDVLVLALDHWKWSDQVESPHRPDPWSNDD